MKLSIASSLEDAAEVSSAPECPPAPALAEAPSASSAREAYVELLYLTPDGWRARLPELACVRREAA